ncbi:MAG: ABC-type multidrug transport system ATPase subunit [Bacteroidia bacterium]|jgi:ABC-type multidrug transport system ATPase subunit
MALLSIQGIHKSYSKGFLGLAKTEVLRGLDLELEAGQTKVLAGPNGSGKSTLLRILAGVEAADAGAAFVDGIALGSKQLLGQVGYLPDGAPFPPELPARRTLELMAALLHMPRKERRSCAEELLEKVGLGHVAKRPIGQFSKGMQRRFALASAILNDPKVLLLDEPTDGLDAEGFGVFDELLEEARKRGAGILVATHVADLPCDEVSVLWNGKIERRGGPELLSGLLGIYRELGQPL